MSSRPVDILEKSRGKKVIIKLKNGSDIIGSLQAFDLHLNIWLEDAEEVKNDSKTRFGSVLVRGDTIVLISPE